MLFVRLEYRDDREGKGLTWVTQQGLCVLGVAGAYRSWLCGPQTGVAGKAEGRAIRTSDWVWGVWLQRVKPGTAAHGAWRELFMDFGSAY